jgi:antirestriction protein
MPEVTNYADIIDSREVIERIEELESDCEITEDEAVELAALRALAAEAEQYAADWRYGEALIRDSYFVTYAQELAEEIGAIQSDAQWPATCIDWERAARELRIDYTSVDFDGVTYWVR